jgi:integrase
LKLTQKAVDSLTLPPGKSDFTFRDDDLKGYGVRMRVGGSKKYVFAYEHGTRQPKVTLGDCSALRERDARKMASELYAKVRLGADPAREKVTARAKGTETVEAALRTYLPARQKKQRPRGYKETERHLLAHARPLHALPLVDIDRREVAGLLTKITASAGEVTANRVRTSLSAFFAWAIVQGLRETNPVLGTTRHVETARERVLSDSEIAAIWTHLDSDDFGAIIRLLLLTGCRANEIGSLRWDEVEGGEIRLAAERTKNGRSHIIPLSDSAQEILDAQANRRPDRNYVFGRTADAPFVGWVKPRHELDKRIAATTGAPLPYWTPHDLRRTAATRLGDLGVLPHVIEAILNHVSGHKAGVAGIYNRATYAAEKRAALTLWAEHVRSVVSAGENKLSAFRYKANH